MQAVSDMRKQGLYPKDTIASLLNVSERRVEQLAKQKIIPKAGRGVFDLGSTVTAYVRYLQGLCSGAIRAGESSELDRRYQEARVLERESKARQAKCRADQMEHELRAQSLPEKLRAKLCESKCDTQVIDEVMRIVVEILSDSS